MNKEEAEVMNFLMTIVEVLRTDIISDDNIEIKICESDLVIQ